MARSLRQSRILDIISRREIDTQEELCEELRKQKFEVTQATVSRDIKELGLVKILTESGRYKYAYVENGEQKVSAKFLYMFRETVISIVRAENIVVLKTISGSANTAALAIDKLSIPEIAGSVAGDDTILVVAVSGAAAERVREKLQSLLD